MSRPTWSGRTPASARARLPASMAASSKLWPSPQLRRSSTPATRCSRPVGSFKRFSTGRSFSSMLAEVVTRVAMVLATLSSATLRCRVVALPTSRGGAVGPASASRVAASVGAVPVVACPVNGTPCRIVSEVCAGSGDDLWSSAAGRS
jgi:hypothetical protein